MTAERQKIIDEWCGIFCHNCVENIDRGTGYVTCLSECEFEKDGIACIHYEGYVEDEA